MLEEDKRGYFITFEGGEGCGKSTQSKMLYQYLVSHNVPVDLTREVGGTVPAEQMRKILLHCDLLPMSELLQIMAARYEHLYKRIIPKLNSGTWVICDRFVDSTACYQGEYAADSSIDFLHKSKIVEGFLEETNSSTAAYIDVCEERRKVSTTKSPTRATYAGSLIYKSKETQPMFSKKITIDYVYNLYSLLVSNIMPDITFWIDLEPGVALLRAKKRGDNNKFEDKEMEFHYKVYKKFQYIASKFSERIIKINAKTLSVEKIHDMIKKKCKEKFAIDEIS